MANQIDLRPQVLDLSLYAGDGVQLRLICTDGSGVPIDVSGTVKAQIRLDRINDDPPIAEFSVNSIDAFQGIIVLKLTGLQTQALLDESSTDKFTGVWDVQWAASSSEPRTLCQGKVECAADVSR